MVMIEHHVYDRTLWLLWNIVAMIYFFFCVQFTPFSGDRLVLSGAEDREVRLHDLNSFETVKVHEMDVRMYHTLTHATDIIP